jgi:glycosyltransferase involved in cell wall biosynthesis
MTEPLRILQVSTFDALGGAANVARNLFRTYRERGHASWMAVGQRTEDDPDVFVIPNDASRGTWARFWHQAQERFEVTAGRQPAFHRAASLAGVIAEPARAIEYQRGIEDFRFPGTRALLDLPPQRPDVVHAHNLHGRYFDLRALPWVTRSLPLVLTLHDAWLLSGHCAHSFDCERWTIGCGSCPDLTIEPAVKRDATALNWRRKAAIFARSELRVATPSRWLMDKVERSMLAPAAVDARVIPNGVDLTVFRAAADRAAVRAALGIRRDASVILLAGYDVGRNRWKDIRTIRAAAALVAERLRGHDVVLVALGDHGSAERVGSLEVRSVPYVTEPETVARYFQAADVYGHAALADTFPTSVLEALACGTPVVATAVGGIPEQIDDGETGFLVGSGDDEAMAEGIIRLLSDDGLRSRMGADAARVARRRFDLGHQADAYLAWYREMIDDYKRTRSRVAAV